MLKLIFTLQNCSFWHHSSALYRDGVTELLKMTVVLGWRVIGFCKWLNDAVGCCRRDLTVMALMWWTSAVFQPGKSGLCSCTSTMFLLQLAWKWELNSTENIFWLSNVCFHFFSDLKLLTFFRMGEMEGYDYIPPKPSLSSGLDWDDSGSESFFSLFGP